MVVKDETGQVTVETSQPLPKSTTDFVDVLGVVEKTGSGIILHKGFYREVEKVAGEDSSLPVLTTAEEIKRLKREDAMRGYPVRIRGVITWSGGAGAVIQDSTMGIFVDDFRPEISDAQRLGQYWEIEGHTTAQFSPMVRANRAALLGPGNLPNPVHPTWDQLMNGTLDTQYVEVQGVVIAVPTNTITLLTHGGLIYANLPEERSEALKRYENALIRIRGCLWAVKDEITHVLKVGEIQIHDASIGVDRQAPSDPFAAPVKRVSELLLFDAEASAFQQIKVAGQVVHERDGEYYLMDGTNGLRFITKAPASVELGGRVEVVGFPALGGASPLLREAVVRHTGHGPLPHPRRLAENAPFSKDYDATLVTAKAQLMNLGIDQNDQVLGTANGILPVCRTPELEIRGFAIRARLAANCKLSGVYVGHGGNRSLGQDIDSFELLLNSPSDIRVLARHHGGPLNGCW